MSRKIDWDVAIGFGGLILGCVGFGYAFGARRKMNDICDKLGTTIDNLSNNMEFDVPQAMIDSAVEKAVDREVGRMVRIASNEVTANAKKSISSTVNATVESIYADIKDAVAKEVSRKVSRLDMDDMTRSIKKQAEEKIVEKFDGSLDDILDKFNSNLNNVSKIYNSMSNAMSRNSERESFLRFQ